MEHLGGIKMAKSYGAEERSIALFGELADTVVGTNLRAATAQADAKYRFDIGAALVLGLVLYVSIAVLHTPAAVILVLLFAFARVMPMVSDLEQSLQQLLNMLPDLVAVLALGDAPRDARRDGACASGASSAAPRRAARRGVVPVRGNRGARAAVGQPDDPGRADDGDRRAVGVRQEHARRSPPGTAHAGAWPGAGGRRAADPGAALRPGASRSATSRRTASIFTTRCAPICCGRARRRVRPSCAKRSTTAAADFVARLPQGLDTVLGDRGVLLSGGERQRVALARALVRRPAMLILDEATSSLDSENERRVQDAIERLHGRLTILVITHRLTTVRGADAIHVLEAGRLVESGSWDDLLNGTAGRFRAMCEAQGLPV